MAKDVEAVCGPLVLGEEYMCPAVEVNLKPAAAERHGSARMWMPVYGPAHCDPEIGNPQAHVHYDERFLTADMVELVRHEDREETLATTIFVAPFTGDFGSPLLALDPVAMNRYKDKLSRRVFRCYRTTFYDRHRYVAGVLLHPGSRQEWRELEAEMIRKRVDPKCMRCPHKGMPLAGVEARGGVITCPGHTLQWREGTGELVPRYPLEVMNAAEVGESEGGAPVQAERPADAGRAA